MTDNIKDNTKDNATDNTKDIPTTTTTTPTPEDEFNEQTSPRVKYPILLKQQCIHLQNELERSYLLIDILSSKQGELYSNIIKQVILNNTNSSLPLTSNKYNVQQQLYSIYLKLQNRLISFLTTIYEKNGLISSPELLSSVVKATASKKGDTPITIPTQAIALLDVYYQRYLTSSKRLQQVTQSNTQLTQKYHTETERYKALYDKFAHFYKKVQTFIKNGGINGAKSGKGSKKGRKSSSSSSNHLSLTTVEQYQDLLLCNICSEREKNAVVSTCGHTMCMPCITSALKSRNRKCPICAQVTSNERVYQFRL
jgi:hypothetical protein